MQLILRVCWTILFILQSNHLAEAQICFEELELCSHCNNTFAHCYTGSSDIIIPGNLSRDTRELVVQYNGPPMKLTASMFQRYANLEYLTLAGNITSLSTNNFAELKYLKRLTLTNTAIAKLPLDLFHRNSTLSSLELNNNQLTRIPLESFRQLNHLEHLSLAYNPIWHPNCLTLGDSFKYLKNLSSLNLANMTVNRSCDKDVPYNFFEALQENVVTLNLTKTNVFNGDQRIFRNFSKLVSLDITLAEGFEKCPGAAEGLFWNLTHSLEKLVLRHLSASVIDPNWGCVLTASNIEGLKALPNLVELDMKYGDLMFGFELTADIFDGFDALESLNLEWCRFSNIEDRVFKGVPRLEWLSVRGNPIGNRPFTISTDRLSCKLRYLNLAQSSLFADHDQDFKLFHTLNSCKVNVVDLTGNRLRHMPILFQPEGRTGGSLLNSIILDSNYLENLQMHFGWDLSGFCVYMDHLRHLSLRMNHLVDIRGLCLTLTHLYLSGNKGLEDHWDINELELSKLV